MGRVGGACGVLYDASNAKDRAVARARVSDVLSGAFEATLPASRCAAPSESSASALLRRSCDGWSVESAYGRSRRGRRRHRRPRATTRRCVRAAGIAFKTKSPSAFSMIPYIHVPDLHVGPLPLHPFGILVATGVLIGTALATRRARLLRIRRSQSSTPS